MSTAQPNEQQQPASGRIQRVPGLDEGNLNVSMGKEIVDQSKLNWDAAKPVLGIGYKYLLPMGRVDTGDPAVIDNVNPATLPDGSPNPDKGEPFTDWTGKNSIGDKILLVPNVVDNIWQAAPVDVLLEEGSDIDSKGTVWIINEMTAEQAQQIDAIVSEYGTDPRNFSASQITEIISRVHTEVGNTDTYDSDPGTTGSWKKLTGQSVDNFGYVQQNKPMVALFVPGHVKLALGKKNEGENGLVVVKRANDEPAKGMGIQPDIFERTYANDPDEAQLSRYDLPLG